MKVYTRMYLQSLIIDGPANFIIHCMRLFTLNSEFFYSNPKLEYDLKVINGLYAHIKRLVPSKDVHENNLI